MAAQIDPYLTDVGMALAVDAKKNGLQLSITHVALGTGKYDSSTSGANKTAMVARKEFVAIPAGAVSGTGGFSCDVVFPEWEGANYEATELGFFSGNPAAGGKLIFIWSSTTDSLVQRNLLQFAASFIFQLARAPSGSITVQLDGQASLAAALIGIHEGKDDPHTRYLKRDGDTATGFINMPTPTRGDQSKKAATTEFISDFGIQHSSSGGNGLTASKTLNAESIGLWYDIQRPGITITLPLASTVPIGATIHVRASENGGFVATQGGDVIAAAYLHRSAAASNRLLLARHDCLSLTRNEAGVWYPMHYTQPATIGQIAYFPGLTAPEGWLHLNGALVGRSDYPRLWAFAQSTGLVTEDSWFNYAYWGRFSVGTTGANFRLMDIRSVMLRGHDGGRGWLDAGREWGRFQESRNRWHVHGVNDGGHSHTTSIPHKPNYQGGGPVAMVDGREGIWGYTSLASSSSKSNISLSGDGGDDARPSNQSYLPAIRAY